MFNTTELILDAFIARIRNAYVTAFGERAPDHDDTLAWVARMVVERISDSDALYHDVEHTVMVTLVGQEILLGKKLIDGDVDADVWLNTMAALLCHDVGYVRGVCDGDGAEQFIVNPDGRRIALPPGASDAALTPHHVDRSKIFVQENLAGIGVFDIDFVARAVERTRFPVPDKADEKRTDDIPGLVRAADLIGQLADPNYMRKINCLFHEFEETGTNIKLGYKNPAALAEGYPKFFWGAVRTYIGDGLRYLQVTQRGKQCIANLTAHVFASEHKEFQLGPHLGQSVEDISQK